jgi:hypothetical protein
VAALSRVLVVELDLDALLRALLDGEDQDESLLGHDTSGWLSPTLTTSARGGKHAVREVCAK